MKPKRLTWQQKRLIAAAFEFGAATPEELGKWSKRSKFAIYAILRKWNWRGE